jgi:endonuclease YncB( thermonuclease family)
MKFSSNLLYVLFATVGVLALAWDPSWNPIATNPATNPLSAPTGAIQPSNILIIDGDTIRISGQTYRLVGFDTPERGSQAKCNAERELAARATRRLREIVARGDLRFNRVACACPPGSEGTRRCNYGRLCGTLTAAGRDVGTILIGEGLARRYICSGTHCPPRQNWC